MVHLEGHQEECRTFGSLLLANGPRRVSIVSLLGPDSVGAERHVLKDTSNFSRNDVQAIRFEGHSKSLGLDKEVLSQ